MHGAVVAQVLGCAGAVLAVGLNAPQAWASCRRRRVAGLSPAARWLAVAHSGTWLAYGHVEQVPLQVVTNVVCVLLHTAVLAALLVLTPAARARQLLVPQALLVLAWAGVVGVCARTGAVPVGLLAAAVGTLAVVPQLWRLWKDPDQDASGISRTTTALSLAANVCWTGHGLLLAEAAVAVPSAVGAVAAAGTLTLLPARGSRRGRRRPGPPCPRGARTRPGVRTAAGRGLTAAGRPVRCSPRQASVTTPWA